MAQGGLVIVGAPGGFAYHSMKLYLMANHNRLTGMNRMMLITIRVFK
jgi:hypothetical protein